MICTGDNVTPCRCLVRAIVVVGGGDLGNMSCFLAAVKFEFLGEGVMVDGVVADKFFYKNIVNFGNMY